MQPTSWIELSRSALRTNLCFLDDMVGPDCRLVSVIKGNAYGHGIETFVPLAEQCGARHFAVFSVEEAERAMKARTTDADLMVMGPAYQDSLEWMVRSEVSFFAYDLGTLQAALEAARRTGMAARVHLEVETGLHRTGLEEHELQRAAELILDNPTHLHVRGLCSHLAGADSVGNYVRIRRQIDRFSELAARLTERGLRPAAQHLACSAAAFVYPETRLDQVRVGIAQYGFWPSKETRMYYLMQGDEETDDVHRRVDPLHRVLSWKSRVVHVKQVRQGQFVGYGTSFLTERPARIALVPVGYAHGFARSLSHSGRVLLRGRRVSVAGLVNMSMMMLDVTDTPGVEVGDEVVLIGEQDSLTMSVASFSDLAQSLNYEALVSLDPQIPRVVVD